MEMLHKTLIIWENYSSK